MPLPRVRTAPTLLAVALSLGVASMTAAAPQRLTVYSGGFDAVSQTRGGNAQAGYALVQRPVRVTPGEWSIDDLPLALDPSTVQLIGDGVAVPPEWIDYSIAQTRSTRLGKVEDIAAMVAMLLSEDGRWINGQVIHVNGGALLT